MKPGNLWSRALRAALAVCLLLGALGACAPHSEPAGIAHEKPRQSWRGSVVVLSCTVLRSDAMGFLGDTRGLTPYLDAFAAEASYRGSAVAASSDPLVALATLLTGVYPWHHQVLSPTFAYPAASLPGLPHLFAEHGYDTVLFSPRSMRVGHFGLERGFARSEPFYVEQVSKELAAFDQLPRFYWAVLPDADLPWAELAPNGNLQSQLTAPDLYPFADPETSPPADLMSLAQHLHERRVTEADEAIGRMLKALRASPAWQESLVVVTGLVGFELREHRQMAYAQNLGRETVEVPLLIKLPSSAPNLAERPPRVAAGRLGATLAEMLGDPDRQTGPVQLASLFRSSDQPMLSALFNQNGANYFSAVVSDNNEDPPNQVILRVTTGVPEREFFRAQAFMAGGRQPLTEDPKDLFARLLQGFRQTSPWRGPSSLTAEEWLERGTRPIQDPERLASLGQILERSLFRYVDTELSPDAQINLPQPMAGEMTGNEQGQ